MSGFALKSRLFSRVVPVVAGAVLIGGLASQASANEEDGPTDHQSVVGKWGVEARRIDMTTWNRSGTSRDPSCVSGQPCTVDLNAIGVRRWMHERYAFDAALALSAGGGSVNSQSWDTHFGVGPFVGANFLLGQAKHLTVSAMPQLGFVAFLPSGSGTKTYLIDVRALVEAEVHLGFIGLQQVSVGTSLGVAFTWIDKNAGDKGKDSVGGASGAPPFSAWNFGAVGPQSLWGLVNNSFLRVYF